jgi:hypothetical protein
MNAKMRSNFMQPGQFSHVLEIENDGDHCIRLSNVAITSSVIAIISIARLVPSISATITVVASVAIVTSTTVIVSVLVRVAPNV